MMPDFYFPFIRRFPAAILICAAVLNAGCAQNQIRPANPVHYEAVNIARFAAPAANAPSKQLIERAAKLTQARNYPYFLLIQNQAKQNITARTQLGVSYGRQPYGFGDAGVASLGPALGFSFSPVFSRRPQQSGQAEWLVYMLSGADKQAVLKLNLDTGLFGAAAPIYKANAPMAEPITVQLR